MLAQAVMLVMIVLNQQISSGTRKGDGGEIDLKGESTLTCHRDESDKTCPNETRQNPQDRNPNFGRGTP